MAVGAFALLLTGIVAAAAIVGGGFGAKAHRASGALRAEASLVMAHRGLRDAHPGNSRGALAAARDAGFDAVEIDVKRAADGAYYLFHDRRSERLLGVDTDLAARSLAELQALRLHRDGRPTEERVLSLTGFADEFADDFTVYLDIKRHGDDDYRRLADDIAGFVDAHGLAGRAIVGGDFLFVTYFEFRFPALHTAIGGPGNAWGRSYRWIPERFRPDFTVVRLDEITPGLVRWLRRTGLTGRWIVAGAGRDDVDRIERLGFSKMMLD